MVPQTSRSPWSQERIDTRATGPSRESGQELRHIGCMPVAERPRGAPSLSHAKTRVCAAPGGQGPIPDRAAPISELVRPVNERHVAGALGIVGLAGAKSRWQGKPSARITSEAIHCRAPRPMQVLLLYSRTTYAKVSEPEIAARKRGGLGWMERVDKGSSRPTVG